MTPNEKDGGESSQHRQTLLKPSDGSDEGDSDLIRGLERLGLQPSSSLTVRERPILQPRSPRSRSQRRATSSTDIHVEGLPSFCFPVTDYDTVLSASRMDVDTRNSSADSQQPSQSSQTGQRPGVLSGESNVQGDCSMQGDFDRPASPGKHGLDFREDEDDVKMSGYDAGGNKRIKE
jgi:hypothetical protein